MIVLAQSGLVPGQITIRATAAGLRPSGITIRTIPASPGIDMPAALPANLPTARRIVSGPRPDEAKQTLAIPKPEPLAFESKGTAQPGAWIESDPLMIPGLPSRETPISIVGGEYRIYNSEWTGLPGKVIGGDAVYVRVKSAKAGDTAVAELTLGEAKVRFEVVTR
jgi:hypothetical protein